MWQTLASVFRRPPPYGRKPALVLINGLAEQAESWFRNLDAWRRHFEVYTPNILAYEGAALHRRIDRGLPVSVDYLVEQLHEFVGSFVQTPPYHLLGSSTGGKVAVEYAARFTDEVDRLVLLGPSGLGDAERLPVVHGLRRGDARALVESVFFNPRRADPGLVRYYREKMSSRRWRVGLLRTIRGTLHHSIRGRLAQVAQPTLLVVGREDRIVDPAQAATAALLLPRGRFVALPRCGHAPHLEQPRVLNPMVVDFLTRPGPAPKEAGQGPGGALARRTT